VIVRVPPVMELMICWDAATVTVDAKITDTWLETVPAEALTITVLAADAFRVVVAVPPVVVAGEGLTLTDPATVPVHVAVTVKETGVPSATAVPSLFFKMAVMVTGAPATGEVGDADKVTDVGALGSGSGNQATPHPASANINNAAINPAFCMKPP
jgi:hypothetical protein